MISCSLQGRAQCAASGLRQVRHRHLLLGQAAPPGVGGQVQGHRREERHVRAGLEDGPN